MLCRYYPQGETACMMRLDQVVFLAERCHSESTVSPVPVLLQWKLRSADSNAGSSLPSPPVDDPINTQGYPHDALLRATQRYDLYSSNKASPTPSQGFTPIHEITSGRNERIKRFYWKLWFGDDKVLPNIDIHEKLVGPDATINSNDVEQFCAVAGNQGESLKVVRNDNVQAPMDFAIVTC